ncbi:AAA family ATPase [Acidobacteria bacterium AH-259-D05]|nr:AAA family ATPase [Acidobacteria bacterium AH-259-D05]
MYLDYWGLQEKPFENTPNPRFLYPSEQHREGLKKLLYAISEEKGCALLTGEYGCGKTHLIRTVVKNLGVDYEVAMINCPIFDGKEFLEEILHQFGRGGERTSRIECFRELSNFFYENVAENRTNILIIDEAQIIDDPDVYEELRLLLNIQLEDRFLLNIQLVGQPELLEHIEKYPQLDQRIAIKFHLVRFDLQDTTNYIKYRLETAGSKGNIFSDAALYLVFKISQGVPRRINNICDLCLLEGSQRKVKSITEEIIKQVF